MPDVDRIVWPAHFEPSNCPVHVRNELDMHASPDMVWRWLVRALCWPDWYPNASRVRFIDGQPPDLAPGTRFRWRTFGIGIESTVQEFVPGERIAWDGRAIGTDVYHAWLIVPTARGCRVLTEETQHGFLTRLSALLMPGRMGAMHQVWLERLEQQAQSGMPPEP